MLPKPLQVIGLTGGIATGKSTACQYLHCHHGLPVLDADVYSRRALAQNSGGWQQVVQRYGSKILGPDGDLDRSALGEIIFSQEAERRWLEAQVHPEVKRLLQEDLAAAGALVVAAIPLLYEVGWVDLCTTVWVVSCQSEQQLQRLRSRNGLTLHQATQRIASQMPLGEKILRADWVLDNSGDLDSLYAQIDRALGTVGVSEAGH